MSTVVETSYSRYLVGVAAVVVGVVFAFLAGNDRLRTPWSWMNYSYVFIFLWVLSLVSAAVAWDQVIRRARKGGVSETQVSTFDFWVVALLLANVAGIGAFYLGYMPVVTVVLFLLALGVTGVMLYLCSEWAPIRDTLTRNERVYPLIAFGLHAVLLAVFIFYTMFAYNATTAPIIRVGHAHSAAGYEVHTETDTVKSSPSGMSETVEKYDAVAMGGVSGSSTVKKSRSVSPSGSVRKSSTVKKSKTVSPARSTTSIKRKSTVKRASTPRRR